MTFLEFLAKAKAPNAVVKVREENPNGAWLDWGRGWESSPFNKLDNLFNEGRLRIKPIKHSVVVDKGAWEDFLLYWKSRGAQVGEDSITVEWEE